MLYCAANMAPSLERRVAIDAARAAGQLLYTELHRPRRVAYKGTPTNLVTEMDARAEELVVGRLLAAFPDDAILAEERGAQAGRSGRRWIIDPLDGTTNYAHGVPVFAVSIGLETARRVQLGVVYDPSRNELYVADRGRGATVNGEPLAVSSTAGRPRWSRVTGGSTTPYSRCSRRSGPAAPRSAASRFARGRRRPSSPRARGMTSSSATRAPGARCSRRPRAGRHPPGAPARDPRSHGAPSRGPPARTPAGRTLGPSAFPPWRPRSRRASAAGASATSPRRSRPRSPSRGRRRGCRDAARSPGPP